MSVDSTALLPFGLRVEAIGIIPPDSRDDRLSNTLPHRCQHLGRLNTPYWLTFHGIANPNNERTFVATVCPATPLGNSLPVFISTSEELHQALCIALSVVLNSFVFDYVSRLKIGSRNVNFFVAKQLPVLPPATHDQACPWLMRRPLHDWNTLRVLELIYVAWDLQPFAQDCGYDGPPFRWDEERRFLLRCELDAAYFHLYGIEREDVDTIMETFPIVKRKDEQRYGEYRTKHVILDIYDAMAEAMRTGGAYQTVLDPPPADPRVAHEGKPSAFSDQPSADKS